MRNKIFCTTLIAATLFTACSKTPAETTTSETTEETTVETTEETTEATTTAAPEPFVFEPHISSETLSVLRDETFFNDLYNLVDALRKGEDTFECSDESNSECLFVPAVLDTVLPAASMVVESAGYENGIVKIKYDIPVEEFVKREADFEEMIVDILNDNVKTTDSDIEKCLKLYDYMANNYEYDFEIFEESLNDGFDVEYIPCYDAFITKKGICNQLGGVYSYLLMQAGVDSVVVGDDGMQHAWSYVTIKDKHYHIDPTWALNEWLDDDKKGSSNLDFFMMSDDERAKDDFDVNMMAMIMAPSMWVNYEGLWFTATDDTYCKAFDGAFLIDLDTENNIIYYDTGDGETQEFHYED